jgi:metal-responsive CopG/Arc/MetJ family transcriptional regulator
MSCYNVMTLILNNRVKNAVKLQDVLTESGCIIKARIGLHEAGDACANEGLIILQLTGSDAEVGELEKKLNSVDGVKAKNTQICSEW